MSEFLAEARVLIRPDTTTFRRDLERQLAAATTRPITVPVQLQTVGTVNQAVAENTALLNANTVAAERDAAAQQQLAAARTQQAGSTRALTAEQTAATVAAQKLAFAQSAVVGAASAVGAAQVTLSRSIAAVAAAERALATAVAVGNAERVAAAQSALAVATAYSAEAEAALVAARAEAAHARTLGAVGTAGLASSASLLGLRGAVLTAGVAFLGATVAIQSSVKAIKTASDTTEELTASVEVFGESSQQIEDFAETAATSLGISNLEALRAANTFGNLFRSINIVPAAAAEMSEQLVRLASDLASFRNADPSQVLDNLRSGLVGEPEPLRKFGVFLTQARAQQEALIATGKKSISSLTQQEIVQARYNLILQDTVIAQGDFERTQDSLANTTRTLKAELSDLGSDLGSALLPGLTNTAVAASNIVRIFQDVVDISGQLAAPLGQAGDAADRDTGLFGDFRNELARVLTPAASLRAATGEIADALDRLAGNTREANEEFPNFTANMDAAERAARLAAFAIVSAQRAVADLGQQMNALEVDQLQIQTGLTGGGREAEIANLRAQIALDKQAVETAKSGSKARRDALEELRKDQRALAILEGDIASEQEDAARDARSAAEEARREREAADRAFLALLGERREDQERRAAAAAETTSLQDDIRAQNRLQAIIRAQIAKIKERVKDEQARRAAIRELRIALIASRREEEELRQQQLEDQQVQIDTVQQLNIDIAIEQGNDAAAERAILARLNRLNKQIKAAKGDQVKVKQLILERERLRNQLKELREEEEKDRQESRKTAQQFFFEQLQAQQGFAANLLGNLIPRDQTAGLVGVPSPQTDIQLQARVAEGRAAAGPTGGQVSTTNDILLRILEQLKSLNRDADAPEAINQRRVGSAAMTGGGGNVEAM